MADRSGSTELRDRRTNEPGAQPAYQAARLAYELGRTVRERGGAVQTHRDHAPKLTRTAEPASD